MSFKYCKNKSKSKFFHDWTVNNKTLCFRKTENPGLKTFPFSPNACWVSILIFWHPRPLTKSFAIVLVSWGSEQDRKRGFHRNRNFTIQLSPSPCDMLIYAHFRERQHWNHIQKYKHCTHVSKWTNGITKTLISFNLLNLNEVHKRWKN